MLRNTPPNFTSFSMHSLPQRTGRIAPRWKSISSSKRRFWSSIRKYIADELTTNDDILQNFTKMMMTSCLQIVAFQRENRARFLELQSTMAGAHLRFLEKIGDSLSKVSQPGPARVIRWPVTSRRPKRSNAPFATRSRVASSPGTVPVMDPPNDQSFEALGLGSLDLLELVDSLETTLCANPFEQTHSLNDMRTVGDLCHAYRTALCEGAETTNSQDDILLASMRRAGARRRLRTP